MNIVAVYLFEYFLGRVIAGVDQVPIDMRLVIIIEILVPVVWPLLVMICVYLLQLHDFLNLLFVLVVIPE